MQALVILLGRPGAVFAQAPEEHSVLRSTRSGRRKVQRHGAELSQNPPWLRIR